MTRIVLASASPIRAELLTRVGLTFDTRPARVDEDAVRRGMEAEGAPPRDIADALAELKAVKVSGLEPGALVIGSDQVLAHDGAILTKPETRDAAEAQLRRLAGTEHRLVTAAVIAVDGQPQWRAVTVARLTMKPLTDRAISSYLGRNWPGVSGCVGGYKLEEEGPRLFQRITGDYFTILGLPLLELCAYLETRGEFEDE
ncbi:septum formation protein Maf [Rhodobacterales bacterium HKCCE2091]|nr:septum formation protein Maf [Rhodobacterales bacterium HKCCE2091]